MPHDYSPAKRAYVTNGRTVSRREVRDQIDLLLAHVEKEAKAIAERYYSHGNISQFEIDMRELLKAGHIVAASVGRGGRARMSQSDWGTVGNKLRWQFQHLATFARKLATGKLDKAYSRNRSRSYASSIYISYANADRVAKTEFVEGGGDLNPNKEPLCMRELNAAESCVECADWASQGWVPVSEQPELGTLQCGDFCKCTLIFEDEV